MLSRRSTLVIDLALIFANLYVVAVYAFKILGGDCRIGAVIVMVWSGIISILLIRMTAWFVRECERHDQETASLLMRLVDVQNDIHRMRRGDK